MGGRVRDGVRERREKLNLFDETLVARQDNPMFLLGPLLYYFWLITVITGVVLMIWYEPTTTGAFSSIERIQHEVPLGWLIRGLHKYAADGLILTIILRIYRMYFLGEYKKPGELSWMLGFPCPVLPMTPGALGQLVFLIQRAFWAAKTVLSVPVYFDQIPIIGPMGFGSMIAYIFLAGPAVRHATDAP